MTWARTSPAGRVHGTAHAKARKTLAAAHDPTDPCVRCGRPLGPMGPHLHLDHHDIDKSRYLGFAHARCNTDAGGRRGRQTQKARAAARRLGITTASSPLRW